MSEGPRKIFSPEEDVISKLGKPIPKGGKTRRQHLRALHEEISTIVQDKLDAKEASEVDAPKNVATEETNQLLEEQRRTLLQSVYADLNRRMVATPTPAQEWEKQKRQEQEGLKGVEVPQVFTDPSLDPVVQKVEGIIDTTAEREAQELFAMEDGEIVRGLFFNDVDKAKEFLREAIAQTQWRAFVKAYPQKANAYKAKFSPIREALLQDDIKQFNTAQKATGEIPQNSQASLEDVRGRLGIHTANQEQTDPLAGIEERNAQATRDREERLRQFQEDVNEVTQERIAQAREALHNNAESHEQQAESPENEESIENETQNAEARPGPWEKVESKEEPKPETKKKERGPLWPQLSGGEKAGVSAVMVGGAVAGWVGVAGLANIVGPAVPLVGQAGFLSSTGGWLLKGAGAVVIDVVAWQLIREVVFKGGWRSLANDIFGFLNEGKPIFKESGGGGATRRQATPRPAPAHNDHGGH